MKLKYGGEVWGCCLESKHIVQWTALTFQIQKLGIPTTAFACRGVAKSVEYIIFPCSQPRTLGPNTIIIWRLDSLIIN